MRQSTTSATALPTLGALALLALAAAAEFEANLPGGAEPGVTALLDTFSQLHNGARVPQPSARTDDYAAVTLGQLKAMARPFYDRLAAAGLGTIYPWPTQGQADDYALANLGQAKALGLAPV
jgi:hypothetical protein